MSVILEAIGLNKKFGAVTAADNISVTVHKNTLVGLIGTNGAGKTTFVNMVTGYLKPDSGTISYRGSDITRLKPREVTRLGICRSFQIPQLYNTLSVRENLGIGLGIVLRNSKKNLFARALRQVPGTRKDCGKLRTRWSSGSDLRHIVTTLRVSFRKAYANCSTSRWR